MLSSGVFNLRLNKRRMLSSGLPLGCLRQPKPSAEQALPVQTVGAVGALVQPSVEHEAPKALAVGEGCKPSLLAYPPGWSSYARFTPRRGVRGESSSHFCFAKVSEAELDEQGPTASQEHGLGILVRNPTKPPDELYELRQRL